MVYFRRQQNPKCFVEMFHESTRLYKNSRMAWGDRVAFFNTNKRARTQIVDVAKNCTGKAIYRATDEEDLSQLEDTLLKRKSTRSYAPIPVALRDIGALMQLSVMARGLDQPDGHLVRRRSYSSAGAIYGIEHYIIGLNVTGFELPFVSYCSAQRKEIILLRENLGRSNVENALGSESIINPAFAVIQTIDLDRVTRKYQERGYRFSLIEAGLAAQTLCLVGLSLNFRSLLWGGHNDHLLDDLLCIKDTNETAINTLFFGR